MRVSSPTAVLPTDAKRSRLGHRQNDNKVTARRLPKCLIQTIHTVSVGFRGIATGEIRCRPAVLRLQSGRRKPVACRPRLPHAGRTRSSSSSRFTGRFCGSAGCRRRARCPISAHGRATRGQAHPRDSTGLRRRSRKGCIRLVRRCTGNSFSLVPQQGCFPDRRGRVHTPECRDRTHVRPVTELKCATRDTCYTDSPSIENHHGQSYSERRR